MKIPTGPNCGSPAETNIVNGFVCLVLRYFCPKIFNLIWVLGLIHIFVRKWLWEAEHDLY